MTELPPICDYEGSDYQVTFWDQGDRAYEDLVEVVALRRLLPSHGKLMLEIGAGAGRNTPRYRGYEHIILMDYSLTQMQQAQTRLGRGERYTYVAGDVYRLPFVSGLFDGATMIRVLHHIATPSLALGEIRRVMQQSGTLILEYASKLNIKAMLRYACKRQDWNPFTLEPVEFVPLNFDFHPTAVRNWLKEAGFEVQRQLTVSHFRLGILKRLFPTKILVALDSLAQLTGDWWQLTPSVFTKCMAVGSSHPPDRNGVIFCCPSCKQALPSDLGAALVCPSCGTSWPVVDGIYDFRGKQ